MSQHSSNSMLHEMFADCDLSPLCSAPYFTVSPLMLSEPTQHEVSREDSVAKRTPYMLNTVNFDAWQRSLPRICQPSERKRKETSSSRETVQLPERETYIC